MKKIEKLGIKLLIAMTLVFGLVDSATAENSCSSKLFSVTIDSKLTISDVIENLADTCGLTVIVSDDEAKQRMNKKLYYVKLKNSTLNGFLNTILTDNDLHYSLQGNKLKISYLITRTFRIHYIAGQRAGSSMANVTIANSNNAAGTGSGGEAASSKTGISIASTDEFQFWKTVEKEIQRILVGAADGSTHYVKEGDNAWVGPDGKVWEYNPLAPIVNSEAGMITVTGTQQQISRVEKYVKTLSDQIKSQVMIDVRILSVSFDDSTKTGVDWNQIFALQNFTINDLVYTQNHIVSGTYELSTGITEFQPGYGAPATAQALIANGHIEISDLVKFLGTQGNVKAISSPRVMTLNNQPALISVGRELFYKIKASSTASSGGGAVAAEGEIVDSVFAGILLDITPEVSPSGLITLKINPSISETVETVKSDGAVRNIPPDLVRRQIASVIKVRDGQHAILGGLISSKTGYENNKVPFLGDIPVLGYAFKSEQKINTVEELVLIITPHVVDQSKDLSLKDLGYSKLNEK